MKQKLISLVMIFGLLVPAGVLAQSADPPENPQSGAVGLEGVVEGEPPNDVPTIISPVDQQLFSSIPITVTGACNDSFFVSVYRNDVFAGSTECNNSSYQIEIDLFSGENTLYARHFDGLGQESENSNEVTVTYDAPGLDISINVADQIILETLALYRGGNPNEPMTWTFGISGGTGPYAANINWGDGENDVVSRSDTGFFDVTHTYKNPGTFPVLIKVSDSNGISAFMQVISVINGPLQGDVQADDTDVKYLYLIWPLYIMAALIVVSFVLGNIHGKSAEKEQLEKSAIEKQKRMKRAAHRQTQKSQGNDNTLEEGNTPKEG